MTSPFDKPDAPGATRDPDAPQWNPEQHIGDLLVIQVQDVQREFETEYGKRDLIVGDVHVIGRDATVTSTYEGAFIFGTVLFSQLNKKKGRTVLGVLEQGEKKPGKKPPWRLADATDQQEAAALRAMASKPGAADPEPERQPEPAVAGKAPWE